MKRKLALNKKTIAHLINDEMHSVYGGATRTCNSCMETDVYVCPSDFCTDHCEPCSTACTMLRCIETYFITVCPVP
jgi:hypothetical protein